MRAGSKRAAASIRSVATGVAERPPTRDDRPALRLALSRGLLALELDSPYRVGPIGVEALRVVLPGIQFPVDLTGGVARFRHRRGALVSLEVEVDLAAVEARSARRVGAVVGHERPVVTLGVAESHLTVGILAGEAALAFDLVLAPLERDLRLLPENARALGLGGAPQVLATRALLAATAGAGVLVGGAVVIPDAVGALLREIMPAGGARAPTTSGARWESVAIRGGRVALAASEGAPPPALDDRALSALELAEMAATADELAAQGDLEAARRRYLELLERAPRHIELSRRLAWLDASLGDRPEAALSSLVEAMPAVDAGLLGGLLLSAIGDDDGARVALLRAATVEPFGPLASLTWLAVARVTRPMDERLRALDEAVARAPSLPAPRWARLDERLRMADLRGARADAEHIEAAARGAEARREVFLTVARAMLARGFAAEARGLFERALRYAPKNLEAALGLARALSAAGEPRRALDVLARAAALAARQGREVWSVQVELARGLADVVHDTPAAIARVQAVPADAPESFEARLLEGRWRAALGDLAGAALALGRLRDAAELRGDALSPAERAGLADLLAEAALVEERDRGDLVAAQRDLGIALRLSPHDREIAARFRRVARAAADRAAVADDRDGTQADRGVPLSQASTPLSYAVTATSATDREPHVSLEGRLADLVSLEATGQTEIPAPLGEEVDAEHDPAADEARAAALADKVRADPADEATVLELVTVLRRLGRDLDLLALVSARIEEGSADLAARLAPVRRETLQRLAARARAEGRNDEASLYESMAEG